MIPIFVLAFLARCLGLIPAVIDDDEAWFAATGAVMQRPGDFFTHAVDNKPPGTAWYYWVVQHLGGGVSPDNYMDPRLARFFFILLLVATAWILGRCASRLRGRDAGWVAALGFFLISPLPSPKLMATTTEGLMLPLISLSVWMWLQALLESSRIRLSRAATAGLALGAALVLKQTAIFFLAPAFYALWLLWRSERLRWPALAAFFVALAIPVGAMLLAVDPGELWYWSYVYPKTVLTHVRGSLFWEWKNLFADLLLLGAVAWPLSVAVAL